MNRFLVFKMMEFLIYSFKIVFNYLIVNVLNGFLYGYVCLIEFYLI